MSNSKLRRVKRQIVLKKAREICDIFATHRLQMHTPKELEVLLPVARPKRAAAQLRNRVEVRQPFEILQICMYKYMNMKERKQQAAVPSFGTKRAPPSSGLKRTPSTCSSSSYDHFASV
jgi:hypothetical protein